MRMQRNYARVAMGVKPSVNILHQNLWREPSHPGGPWQDCAVDILGPLPSEENLLVVVDYYSRYFEVVILKSTTSTKIIASLKPIFARFGVPYTLKN